MWLEVSDEKDTEFINFNNVIYFECSFSKILIYLCNNTTLEFWHDSENVAIKRYEELKRILHNFYNKHNEEN